MDIINSISLADEIPYGPKFYLGLLKKPASQFRFQFHRVTYIHRQKKS
jgi:hypothetical protein